MEDSRPGEFSSPRLLGRGECGEVHAVFREGEWVAVKRLETLAVNRVLLGRMFLRLERGGWPEAVVPLLDCSLQGTPAALTMPLLADPGDEDAGWRPRSLQHQLGDFPGARSWEVVRELAAALASLHQRQVAHGNLKPGNVFFDENGRLLLSDWTLGNMPEVTQMEYTDAVLYQPPEQLRHPEGYYEEAGYRWDVFAFATLSYRLLTGQFPRCHETFIQVAPPPGETRKEGLVADLEKVAVNLEAEAEVSWPGEPSNELEKRYREVIGSCLQLDPRQRPATMVEVEESFADIDQAAWVEQERAELLAQRRRANRRGWIAAVAALVLLLAAGILGALAWNYRSGLERERVERRNERDLLTAAAADAAALRDEAVREATEARQQLNRETQRLQARLAASREIGDRLFAWAMEKGNRKLPPLDGRELRLNRLERYYRDFLDRTEGEAALAEEHARARLQLAEISLARNEAEEAARRLEGALEEWEALGERPRGRLRIATDRLLLALLYQQLGELEKLPAAFAAAREAIQTVPDAEGESDRLQYLLAVLDFHQARHLAEKGEDGEALRLLMEATQELNALADSRPDSVVVRAELARCYLDSATVLEGLGRLGDAREVRKLAAVELAALVEKSPEDFSLKLELAGTYGAMAEEAMLAGDAEATAGFSERATGILRELLSERPEHPEVNSRLAAQQALMAGLLRDQGKAEEAAALLDGAQATLEGVVAAHPESALSRYRLALVLWQKGRVEATGGSREASIEWCERAATMLKTLEEEVPAGLRVEQVRRSLAYVYGDLGHACQLEERMDDAQAWFAESVKMWNLLQRGRPGSEEYGEGLAWSRQRLAEVEGRRDTRDVKR